MPVRSPRRLQAGARRGPAGSRFTALALACAVGLTACAGPSGDGAKPASAPTTSPADLTGAVVIDGPFPVEPLVEPHPPSLPVTVTDARGETVTITDTSRIVPLTSGIAETVFSLGLGGQVVGRDLATTFAQAADLPVVTHAHDVSAEGVLSLRPTVVLADTWTAPSEALTQIRSAGVPVVVFGEVWSISGIAPRITAVAEALGVPTDGRRLVERTDAAITASAERAGTDRSGTDRSGTEKDPLTVAFLYLRGTAAVYLLGGKGSGADALVESLGAVDAGSAEGLDSFTPITSEALIAARPDVILVMTKGLESVGGVAGLVKLPGVAQTPAGQKRQVVAVEDGVLLSFGPRTPLVLERLADALARWGT